MLRSQIRPHPLLSNKTCLERNRLSSEFFSFFYFHFLFSPYVFPSFCVLFHFFLPHFIGFPFWSNTRGEWLLLPLMKIHRCIWYVSVYQAVAISLLRKKPQRVQIRHLGGKICCRIPLLVHLSHVGRMLKEGRIDFPLTTRIGELNCPSEKLCLRTLILVKRELYYAYHFQKFPAVVIIIRFSFFQLAILTIVGRK